jgi:hypothetical protein
MMESKDAKKDEAETKPAAPEVHPEARSSEAAEDHYDYGDYEEEELTEEEMAGEECGRWINGRLGKYCGKAGTEECDWICPYSR